MFLREKIWPLLWSFMNFMLLLLRFNFCKDVKKGGEPWLFPFYTGKYAKSVDQCYWANLGYDFMDKQDDLKKSQTTFCANNFRNRYYYMKRTELTLYKGCMILVLERYSQYWEWPSLATITQPCYSINLLLIAHSNMKLRISSEMA